MAQAAARRRSARSPRGFTYVAVLALLAVLGIGLAALGPQWADAARREREAELLRVGALYAQALRSYRDSSPGSLKRFPPTLQALLEDPRHVGLVRHLRRPYADPIDPTQPWGLLRDAAGGIRAVYSTSALSPLRREPLELPGLRLPAAATYQDWHFEPAAAAPVPPTTTLSAATP